jgi:hypothetical protein
MLPTYVRHAVGASGGPPNLALGAAYLGGPSKAAWPHRDGIGYLAWYEQPAPHRFGGGFAAAADVKLSQDR